jgi:LysR family transcriptional regulator, glycine cleavage system transcriptional activator
MERRDLPLTALRSFEAVGRALSFALAAKTLGVTHGAVSRQVTALEERLGTRLFERGGRLSLTQAGEALLAEVSPAFDQLTTALEAAGTATDRRTIVVNAPPTFTIKWLIPRLSLFHREHIDAEVRLFTGIGPVSEIKMDAVDLAIRRLPPGAGKTASTPFLSSTLLAVCAPELIERRAPTSIEDVARLPLIEAATAAVGWHEWFDKAGHRLPNSVRFNRFEQMFLALEAALEGLGVALLPSALILDDVAARRLTVAWHREGVYDRDYCFVKSPLTRNARMLASFTDWLSLQGQECDSLLRTVLPQYARQDQLRDRGFTPALRSRPK